MADSRGSGNPDPNGPKWRSDAATANLNVTAEIPKGAQLEGTSTKEAAAFNDPRKALETELALEKKYAQNPSDLEVAFDLLSILIVRYRLNRSDEILDAVESRCMKENHFKQRFHQSKAFVRYKQARYLECIREFEAQEQLIMKGVVNGSTPGRDQDGFCFSVPLNENIGHCLSSMNRLEDAEKRFTAALRLMQAGDPQSSENDVGGILVGLGLVKDRLGDPEGAVSVLQAAVSHYKKVHGEDGSTLIAKALTSLGRCKELTNQLKEAGNHFSEAVKIFEKRAGKGPLLAGALGHLGKNQLKQQKFDSATASLYSAVELEVQKDALDLNLIWELIEALKTCWIGLLNSNKTYAEPAAELGKRAAEMAMSKTPNDWKNHNGDLDSNIHGTTALIYMLGGEFAFAARDFDRARIHLASAVTIFSRIRGFECGSFLEACKKLQMALP
eukprot:m.88701 g.88701  ORF g.88701 m.88701 type:complete len:444 (+) comp26226_c0_seq1:225-1556(+)